MRRTSVHNTSVICGTFLEALGGNREGMPCRTASYNLRFGSRALHEVCTLAESSRWRWMDTPDS